MDKYKSILSLRNLVYDKIEFDRKGFKNEKEAKFRLQVQTGVSKEKMYKVTLTLYGEKEEEYSLVISLSGFFTIDEESGTDERIVNDLINKNAVSILMPYLRSELTILTSQPGTDSIILPPFNVNKMMNEYQREKES